MRWKRVHWCLQEYQERSANITKLREDFGRENDVLQAATAALNEKRVRNPSPAALLVNLSCMAG